MPSSRRALVVFVASLTVLSSACDGAPAMPEPMPPTTLRDGAAIALAVVYEAGRYTDGPFDREWHPVDLAVHPGGALWLVQRMERDPGYDDETECTTRGLAGNPSDCVSLQGSTVALRDPAAAEPATADNGRATLVVDANAWHFMRRPSAIAFGAAELVVDPASAGAAGAMLTEPVRYLDTFATCAEHWTGNATDEGAFIGPSLWTADPAIYDGSNGSFEWSNGSHLDMVHATEYCVGIAYEGGNAYWTFNGRHGVLDRYDFGAPHYTGHYDHSDAIVRRYFLAEGDELERLPYVPSNMAMDGADLFVADTGNDRVLRIDTASPTAMETGTFRTHEGITATEVDFVAYQVIADASVVGAEPSGLAILDDETLVVASHAAGTLTLIARDGTPIRTIDTGLGSGIGGLEVLDGTVYFVHMPERRVYRVDVVAPAAP